MAFLVVEIHARPLMGFPLFEGIIEGIDVVAVPFFFIASAFLCFRGLDEYAFINASYLGAVRVRKTIEKLLRLYLTWTLLFLPLTVLGNILLGNSFSRALFMFLRGMLLVGENCYSWPLWYLLASVVGFALVYICLRGGVRLKRILLISLCLLLLGYCITFIQKCPSGPTALSLLVKAYGIIFGSTRNGLFEGFFYVAVGAVFGMRWESLNKAPTLFSVALFVIGVCGSIYVCNDAHLPFCMLASIGLFLLSVRRCGTDLKSHDMARKASTIIYLVHMFFIVLFVFGICGGTEANLYANNVSQPLLYLFSLCGSALTSALVIAGSIRFPSLKRVFGI